MCVCVGVCVCGCHMGVFLSSMFTNDSLCLNKCKLIELWQNILASLLKMTSKWLHGYRMQGGGFHLLYTEYLSTPQCALMTE